MKMICKTHNIPTANFKICKNKRDFLQVSTYALGAVGAASFVWPLINQMNPAADTLALASTEVDLEQL